MPIRSTPRVFSSAEETLSPEALRGLNILRKARASAVQARMSVWEFAVPVGSLRSQRVDDTDLRLLCALGLADCRIEQLTPNTQERTFSPLVNLAMPDCACLVATKEGLEYPLEAPAEPMVRTAKALPASVAAVPQAPSWVEKSGVLWWGDRVLKTLRGHAKNQRLLLSAFEEARWSRRVDDPLPPDGKVRPKERLRQTVRFLNKGHAFPALEFSVDEEYRGIYWDPV